MRRRDILKTALAGTAALAAPSVVQAQNADVAGHIITGPYGSINIGPNGSVGSVAWVDANTKGIEPGYRRNDMNVIFDDVILPATSWLPTGSAGDPTGGSGPAPDGNTYDRPTYLTNEVTSSAYAMAAARHKTPGTRTAT